MGGVAEPRCQQSRWDLASLHGIHLEDFCGHSSFVQPDVVRHCFMHFGLLHGSVAVQHLKHQIGMKARAAKAMWLAPAGYDGVHHLCLEAQKSSICEWVPQVLCAQI